VCKQGRFCKQLRDSQGPKPVNAQAAIWLAAHSELGSALCVVLTQSALQCLVRHAAAGLLRISLPEIAHTPGVNEAPKTSTVGRLR
jgi:hypothetical protein